MTNRIAAAAELLPDKLDALGWYQIHPDHSAPADFVEQLESALGCPLPADYRAFLAHFPCDSGPDRLVTSPIISGPAPGGDPGLLACFAYNPDQHLQHLMADTDLQIPGMMIFGDDIFGNWFYLDLAEGSVWFLDRDGGEIARENLALVGRSFADFIARMVIDPEDDKNKPVKRPLLTRLHDWLA